MKLFREIGLASATSLVIGNMIGVGIFTTTGLIIQELGSSWWLLGVWVLGGAIALIGATCYSLLGKHMPHAGGEYAFLYPTYGPLPAFLAGWTSLFIGFSAPIAAAALGLAYYLDPFIQVELSEQSIIRKSLATVTVVLTSLCLSLGLRIGTQTHASLTLLMLCLMIGFSIMVLGHAPDAEYLRSSLFDGTLPTTLPSLASAIVLVMFAYSGWNAAAYIAEEIRDPARNLPRALIIGTLTVIGLYLLVNVAYLSASPLTVLDGNIAIAEITASQVLGPAGHTVLLLLIVLAIVTSITAMSIAGPRVYFAMARHGLFPASLTHVHPTKKIPLNAIWFQTAIACVLIWVGTLYQILLYSGSILLLFSTLTTSVVFKLWDGQDPSASVFILYRVLPAIFIVVNLTILLNVAFAHPTEAIAGLGTIALGIPVYFVYRKRLTAT